MQRSGEGAPARDGVPRCVRRFAAAMRVTCPQCGRAVEGRDIDLAARSAVCRPCGELFALPDVGGLAASRGAALFVGGIGPVPKPDDLQWEEESRGDATRAIVRRSKMLGCGLGAFALVWNGFLLVMYGAMLSAKHTPTFALLFPILHVAAGVFVAWLALVALLNKTTIVVEGGTLRIARGPIFEGRDVVAAVHEINGFEVTELYAGRGNRGQPSLRVMLLTQDGRSRATGLVFGDAGHARYVAARLGELVKGRGGGPYRG